MHEALGSIASTAKKQEMVVPPNDDGRTTVIMSKQKPLDRTQATGDCGSAHCSPLRRSHEQNLKGKASALPHLPELWQNKGKEALCAGGGATILEPRVSRTMRLASPDRLLPGLL